MTRPFRSAHGCRRGTGTRGCLLASSGLMVAGVGGDGIQRQQLQGGEAFTAWRPVEAGLAEQGVSHHPLASITVGDAAAAGTEGRGTRKAMAQGVCPDSPAGA